MRVLVTGASGFVGRAVVTVLLRQGHQVRAAIRGADPQLPPEVERVVVPDLASSDLGGLAAGCDAVAHLAGRVHVLRDPSADPLTDYRRVNVAGTAALLAAAVEAGANRFLFVSSIKVNGEGASTPYTESVPPAPVDWYGASKLEAEQAVAEYRDRIETVVVRPPLVYGPGVRGNFRRLLRLVDRSWWLPLPLGALAGRRSLIFVANLADAIGHLLESPSAPGRTFLASDNEDLTTSDLIRRLATVAGIRPRLVPVPPAWLRTVAAAVGREAEVRRLVDPLTVDISALRSTGWAPPFTVNEGLAETVRWWRGHRSEAS